MANAGKAITAANMVLEIKQGRQNAPVGRCIYCDATQYDPKEPDRPLGREHIIPKSLAGNQTLPRASCKLHEDVTKAFEQRAAREIFQHVRLKLGIKMSEPPSHLKAVKDWDSGSTVPNEILIPTEDHPGFLALAGLSLPKILTKDLPNADIPAGFWFKVIDEGLASGGVAPEKPSKFFHSFAVDDQARLLAKIAFAMAVAAVGLDGFDTSPMRGVICDGADWTEMVGGTLPSKIELPSSYKSSRLHDAVVYSESIDGERYVACQVRLFAMFGAPVFTVIVGKLTEKGAVQLDQWDDRPQEH